MNDSRAYKVVYRYRDISTKKWRYIENYFVSNDPSGFLRIGLSEDAEVLFVKDVAWSGPKGYWITSAGGHNITATEAREAHARHRYETSPAGLRAQAEKDELYRQARPGV